MPVTEKVLKPVVGHEPCHRCNAQPVVSKQGSYWRARCVNHTSLLGGVMGHPMSTRREALEQWDAAMRNEVARKAAESQTDASQTRTP